MTTAWLKNGSNGSLSASLRTQVFAPISSKFETQGPTLAAFE